MTALTKDQRNQLHAALMHAFPGWVELSLMVDLQLDKNLEEISSSTNKLPKVVLDLIRWAESHGKLAELVAGALAANPDNPLLKKFAATMQAAQAEVPPVPAQPTPAGAAAPPLPEDKEHYERLIWKAVDFAGTAAFREAMMHREAAVCRVEFPAGKGQGTGFLVGADLLLTNYHVLEDFIGNSHPPATVAFRFDYQTNVEGTETNTGRVVRVAKDAQPWLLSSSPVRNGGLDYALVRLDTRVGAEPMSGARAGTTRGWLTLEAHAFEIGESVFVLQHPKAAPLKIAAGGVAKAQSTRVYYLANTLDGSSGSPVFTSDWRLAALHHASDGIANVGVPCAAILPALAADGITLE